MINKEQYYEFLDASIAIIDSVRQLRDYGSWTEEKFALMLALDQTARDFGFTDFPALTREAYETLRQSKFSA